ncbi:MAG: hypothetical protein LIO41_01190 [Ruminococcus sp.]|nr:hypothetical protein [Ruminococcus sp.]
MYNDIKLDKTMYNISGKSFSSVLSDLDPDEEYADTPLNGLDAFERQLKRFDIKISGNDCDNVSKFFTTSESAVLFPEFIRRQIKLGFDDAFILGDVAASMITVDDNYYGILTVEDDGTDCAVAEGGEMGAITITTSNSSVNKYAKALKISYESIRQKRIDTFAVILKQLGMTIANSINAQLLPPIGEISTTTTTVAEADFSYSSLIDFWTSMEDFEMDTILCSKTMYAKILEFGEIKNQVSTGVSTNSSSVKTPFGVTIIPVAGLSTPNYYGLSSKYCYELVQSGDMTVETGKLITLQFDQIAASVSMGISKINPAAIIKLTLS